MAKQPRILTQLEYFPALRYLRAKTEKELGHVVLPCDLPKERENTLLPHVQEALLTKVSLQTILDIYCDILDIENNNKEYPE